MNMYSYKVLNHINEIDASSWDALFDDNPFTKHAFIYACEASLSATKKTGWIAHHLLIYHNETLITIIPGYLKTHSYGEYVFDWSWAEAYKEHGLDYYPKWIGAIPFTPIEGVRLAYNKTISPLLYQFISTTLEQLAQKNKWSGWHFNFCDKKTSKQLKQYKITPRLGVQFQWFNKSYQDFNGFLSKLTARKRKNIRKERKKVLDQDIKIEWLNGHEISDELIIQFVAFYQRTYLKRSGHLGYLNADFFSLLKQNMPKNLVIMTAKKSEKLIAATWSLKSSDTLYGRYWGANEQCDLLHFELCYYQGIEYCINNDLKCFHSGAQGEHKIARGFEPVFTYSNHKIMHPDFALAIDDFLQRETLHMRGYFKNCQALSPFKKP
ncbi:GNAT family N-acetyltransferase [Pseudoalteromonas sp. NBT06-2]|uniref:GNAT family N-acetyltransferase n=1 Tax=Pseudoalteromonas sp. NBT06-2 TaxID=2025950 RepID=UPI000BA63D07|nr:GNAT family N-acetyltransferase [Pseudoalteromonas sp. NBT06-2]PAJ74432.1 GNAT family N-acetyltransferase [Pseudoalteromonas sp. NBT06-2]